MPKTVLSIIESPTFPKLSAVFKRLGVKEIQVSSTRKAMNALKTHKPDFIFAEFFYGYGNNYAGVNISNLDVFLYSLAKYARDCRVIVCYEKADKQYVQKLEALFPSINTLTYPIAEAAILPYLKS